MQQHQYVSPTPLSELTNGCLLQAMQKENDRLLPLNMTPTS
jgi:hypothetical protein